MNEGFLVYRKVKKRHKILLGKGPMKGMQPEGAGDSDRVLGILEDGKGLAPEAEGSS